MGSAVHGLPFRPPIFDKPAAVVFRFVMYNFFRRFARNVPQLFSENAGLTMPFLAMNCEFARLNRVGWIKHRATNRGDCRSLCFPSLQHDK